MQVARGNVLRLLGLVVLNVVRRILIHMLPTLPQEVAMNSLIDFAAHRLFQTVQDETKTRCKAGFGFTTGWRAAA